MCKTSHQPLRNVASCERIKSNWKLQYRKDELNILKYLKTKQEENIEPQVPTKIFKVRKLFKKCDDFYKINPMCRKVIIAIAEKQLPKSPYYNQDKTFLYTYNPNK